MSAIAVTSMQLAASAHGQRATNYSTNYGANRSAAVTNVGMALLCVLSTLLQVHGYRLSCAPKRLRTLPIIGSGIMRERLAGGNVAIALLANTLATGAMLARTPLIPR
jgi:hypothetical protein